jgi:superfamily II DNA or RNA helicase/formylglycine-generating enzyme required for sulfatase activity
MSIQAQILSALTVDALRAFAKKVGVSLAGASGKEAIVARLTHLKVERIAGSLNAQGLRIALGKVGRVVSGDVSLLRKRLVRAGEAAKAHNAARDAATEPRLHPYQIEAIDALLPALADSTGPVCLQLPTGAGKTRTTIVLLDRWLRSVGGSVLWVTKDWRLLQQTANDVQRLYPKIGQGRIGGETKLDLPEDARGAKIVYTTVHTFMSRVDEDGDFERFGLIVWDECHWGHDARVGRTLFHFAEEQGTPLLGLTATPRQSRHFNVAYGQAFSTLVEQGYLARPIVHDPVQTGMVWEPTLSTAGDFTAGSLAQLGNNPARNKLVVKHYKENAHTYGPTIVFACNIDHANTLVRMFKKEGVTVAPIHSAVDPEVAANFLEQYRRGAVRVLVNVDMLTHGVDLPDTHTIFLCRPTRSDILFSQMVGRGSRITPEKKTFHVVEFADNITQHGELLVRPRAFFGGGDGREDNGARSSAPRLPFHRFDPTGLPAWISSGLDMPAPLRGLWYRRGQTFGIEFELTRVSGIPQDPESDDWLETATAILEKMREASARVADLPLPFYAGTDAGAQKDMTVWNIEFDRSAGWEVTSPILMDEGGYCEAYDVCLALDAVAKELGLVVNHNTGTHVHLGWKDRPVEELCKLVRLAHLAEPALATLVAPSRIAAFDGLTHYLDRPNPYCQPISAVASGPVVAGWHTAADVAATFASHEKRYVTLNLRSIERIGTVEVRLHSGTVDGGKILLWLSLWQQMLSAAGADGIVPDAPARGFITPDGDIVDFARRYLPSAADPAQGALLGRLHRRRLEVLEQWRRHTALHGWLPFAARWQDPAVSATAAVSRSAGERVRVTGTGLGGEYSFEMTFVPAGRFVMGSPVSEEGRDADEQQHEVRLTGSLEVGVFPVTQGLYEAVMGSNPSGFKGKQRPVERVSWYDAVRFCNALSRSMGLAEAYRVGAGEEPSVEWDVMSGGYRLLTEAEWEYSARAGGKHLYAGSDRLEEVGWTEENSGGETHPVGQRAANGWGLYDMSGNVWEWVWDRYGDYCTGAVVDPMGGPADEINRVSRGGSWGLSHVVARVAFRDGDGPGDRYGDLGFRLAKSYGP